MHKFIRSILLAGVLSLAFIFPMSQVSAESGVLLTKTANSDNATLGETITYTYNIVNKGVVEIKNIILNDNKLGNIPLTSDNVTITKLAPGESASAVVTYKVIFSDLLAGSIRNIATVTGEEPNGKPVTASSGEVEVSTNIIKALLTKAEIFKTSGIPGKGIDNAPGLQKPFNLNSQAAENAGKKDGNGNLEQNQNQEMNGNIEQNHEQEMNKNKDKNKGKGQGKNNK